MRERSERLEEDLNTWYNKVCTTDFIAADPVQFPRRYKKREDIEIAAFLAATIAWGRRDMILRSAEKMFALMEPSPYGFVMSGAYKKLKNANIHRTFFEDDLKYYCKGLQRIFTKYGNLEKLFLSASNTSISNMSVSNSSMLNVWEGFALFREEMAAANAHAFSKHISNPGEKDKGGSACKRLNLALRWLVREGPVDLSLWKKIKPSALYIPLDVHVARTARKLKLLRRRSNDKMAVIELTEKLREYCPQDPVKYDFALFGMGVLQK